MSDFNNVDKVIERYRRRRHVEQVLVTCALAMSSGALGAMIALRFYLAY